MTRQAFLNLGLLLVAVMCNASLVPFMGVYIVEGLEKSPIFISIYSTITIIFILFANRKTGEMIDGGTKIAPLILAALCAFVIANIAILVVQSFWVLVSVGSLCFAISSTAVSTMYSYGRLYAEQAELDIDRYNSYLRSMTSLGWMIAPAISFFIAGEFGEIAVFKLALGFAVLWALMWIFAMPKDFAHIAANDSNKGNTAEVDPFNLPLYIAAVTCFCFSLAHILCSSALPLFIIQEAGLPKFAPGLAFSVKTIIEIMGILAGPVLVRRFGVRNVLLVAGLIALLAFQILSSTTSLPWLLGGAMLEGLYYGIFAGVGITFVQSLAKGRIARATSLYMNALFVGGLVAGIAMGVLAQTYDFRTTIQLASIGAIAALIILVFSKNGAKSAAHAQIQRGD
ncbi:MAG: MFS transporter [Cohaesibacteraceae bacterium]|nr:MFS transporter [Cohaesibacteraceae bacterium]